MTTQTLVAAGVLVYASDLARMSLLYEQVLGMSVRTRDAHHHALSAADAPAGIELVVHAIPAHIAATFTISVPPEPREGQAYRARNVCDPEGNIRQLREARP